MQTGIHIGLSSETATVLRRTVVDILKSKVSEKVKLAALKTIKSVGSVTNVTVDNCQIGDTIPRPKWRFW